MGRPLDIDAASAASPPWYYDPVYLFPILGISAGLIVLGAWCAAGGDGARRRRRSRKGRQLLPQDDEDEEEDEDEDLEEYRAKKGKKGKAKKEKKSKKSGGKNKKSAATATETFMGFKIQNKSTGAVRAV